MFNDSNDINRVSASLYIYKSTETLNLQPFWPRQHLKSGDLTIKTDGGSAWWNWYWFWWTEWHSRNKVFWYTWCYIWNKWIKFPTSGDSYSISGTAVVASTGAWLATTAVVTGLCCTWFWTDWDSVLLY